MTIFVLDDDPSRLDAFASTIGDRASVVTASTVLEAVAYFERVLRPRPLLLPVGWETRVAPPDALFLDHDLCDFTEDMVERTGQTFASWLAQHNDNERLIPRNTPIVLHSFNPAGVQAMSHILRVRGGFSLIAAIPFGPDALSVARGLTKLGVTS